MHVNCVLILALALSAVPVSTPPNADRNLDPASNLPTTRRVVGSLADVLPEHPQGRDVTVMHILEFTPQPVLDDTSVEVRLCGDHTHDYLSLVHTNIELLYQPVSASKSTGCMTPIRIHPWQDSSPWHTIRVNAIR